MRVSLFVLLMAFCSLVSACSFDKMDEYILNQYRSILVSDRIIREIKYYDTDTRKEIHLKFHDPKRGQLDVKIHQEGNRCFIERFMLRDWRTETITIFDCNGEILNSVPMNELDISDNEIKHNLDYYEGNLKAPFIQRVYLKKLKKGKLDNVFINSNVKIKEANVSVIDFRTPIKVKIMIGLIDIYEMYEDVHGNIVFRNLAIINREIDDIDNQSMIKEYSKVMIKEFFDLELLCD